MNINGALCLKLNVLGNNCNDDDLILITTTPTIKEEWVIVIKL